MGRLALARDLGRAPQTIVLSEDFRLSRLFGAAMTDVADYGRYAEGARTVVGPLVKDLLGIGVSVVLDFPANTFGSRAWMRSLVEAAHADHRLHRLEVSVEVCRTRLRAPNAAGAHDFAPSGEAFDQITRCFVPPTDAEGFNVVRR